MNNAHSARYTIVTSNMRSQICLSLIILTCSTCFGQSAKIETFGTLNIDHHSIAIDFMTKFKQRNYEHCYKQTSDDFRSNLNFEDFQFKMRMLQNVTEEDFYHYNTTFIGKTAKEGLAILNGEKVTENIMPEFDFTIGSEAKSDFKKVRIFIRFENENSEKISVINFSKHERTSEQSNSSRMSSNPFFIGNYILIVEDELTYHVDIRGENLREKLTQVAPDLDDEVTAKVSFTQIKSFIPENDLSTFSLIHVIERKNLAKASEIEKVAYENGFSVFNHRNKNYRLTPVDNLEEFLGKYEQGHWNPIAK